ncbi:MAG: right-handed parallel beta-helix repeat-containing protein [Candidatus Bathyarchaeota archaeon]|nr:right-handed parallel beta-helix repeat-containing protein [Candidatus Bathyarchaeota archaeon]
MALSFLALAFTNQPTNAQVTASVGMSTITIQTNGDVTPTSALIQRVGSTYILTENISGYNVLIQCSNIVLDGAGFGLQCTDCSGIGVLMEAVANVTVQNLIVEGFDVGVCVINSSDCTVQSSRLVNNGAGLSLTTTSGSTIQQTDILQSRGNGIQIQTCSGTIIFQNTLTQNSICAISVANSSGTKIVENTISSNARTAIDINMGSSDSIVFRNTIAENNIGLILTNSTQNIILGNTIQHNTAFGIKLQENQANNLVYSNNFIDNSALYGFQVSMPWPNNPVQWDNGKAGNYWSDYQARYPNATQTSSAVGDTAYFINENNMDHHPLWQPVTDPQYPNNDLAFLGINAESEASAFPIEFVLVGVFVAALLVVFVIWFKKVK